MFLINCKTIRVRTRIALRDTISTVLLNNNIPVKAVLASQVQEIVLSHVNDRIRPNVFTLSPKQYTSLKARIPTPEPLRTTQDQKDLIPLRFCQLPVILNNATTGHKLQGSSVDNLFVHQWKYVQNWAYVVLSRVRTMLCWDLRFTVYGSAIRNS